MRTLSSVAAKVSHLSPIRLFQILISNFSQIPRCTYGKKKMARSSRLSRATTAGVSMECRGIRQIHACLLQQAMTEKSECESLSLLFFFLLSFLSFFLVFTQCLISIRNGKKMVERRHNDESKTEIQQSIDPAAIQQWWQIII